MEKRDRAVYRRYVIDDGWNLPEEVIEAIDLKVKWAKECVRRRIYGCDRFR